VATETPRLFPGPAMLSGGRAVGKTSCGISCHAVTHPVERVGKHCMRPNQEVATWRRWNATQSSMQFSFCNGTSL